jgi:uncharacterized membrane protein YbaN (DUF454 family)
VDIGLRLLWLFIGLLSVALGAIGVVVPLLPTTPFLLLAAFAFARSSARLTKWLHEHRKFGPLIDNWQQHGSIDRKSKIWSMVVIILAPILTLFTSAPLWAVGVQVAVLACSATFILTRPLPPDSRSCPAEPANRHKAMKR